MDSPADGFKLALIYLDDKLAGQDARIVHILHKERVGIPHRAPPFDSPKYNLE